MTKTLKIVIANVTVPVTVEILDGTPTFKLEFTMPECGCRPSFTGTLDHIYVDNDWAALIGDIKRFVTNITYGYVDGSKFRKVHYCVYCGKSINDSNKANGEQTWQHPYIL